MATLNGSSRVLKVIDIIDKGPNAEQPALGMALWPCISTALKAWWLTSISLVDRNEECGPRAGNLVGRVPKRGPSQASWGIQWAYPQQWGEGGRRRRRRRVLCCCYHRECTAADCTASMLAFICPLSHGGTMNPRRLSRCLSLSHLGWAGWGRREGGSPCSWSSSHHLIGLTYWVLTFQ